MVECHISISMHIGRYSYEEREITRLLSLTSILELPHVMMAFDSNALQTAERLCPAVGSLTLAKASLNQCWSFYIYPQSFSLDNQEEDEPHTDTGGLEYSVMLGLQCCVGETVFATGELSCRA